MIINAYKYLLTYLYDEISIPNYKGYNFYNFNIQQLKLYSIIYVTVLINFYKQKKGEEEYASTKIQYIAT